jgi:hypothetical protein
MAHTLIDNELASAQNGGQRTSRLVAARAARILAALSFKALAVTGGHAIR